MPTDQYQIYLFVGVQLYISSYKRRFTFFKINIFSLLRYKQSKNTLTSVVYHLNRETCDKCRNIANSFSNFTSNNFFSAIEYLLPFPQFLILLELFSTRFSFHFLNNHLVPVATLFEISEDCLNIMCKYLLIILTQKCI